MDGTRLLVSDLDGTLLGDDKALQRFADWIGGRRDYVRLAYNSGRFYDSVRHLVDSTPLPVPDAVISGVGTEIRWFPDGRQVEGWPRCAAPWQRSAVRTILARDRRLDPQPEEFQSEFKLSYYARDLEADSLVELHRVLIESGHTVQVVYSSRRDLDVLPAGVDKGAAASFLASQLGLHPGQVIVAGDTGNDAAMFRRGFLGIVVGNAQAELKSLRSPDVYQSDRPYADGVLEGFEYWLRRQPAPMP